MYVAQSHALSFYALMFLIGLGLINCIFDAFCSILCCMFKKNANAFGKI